MVEVAVCGAVVFQCSPLPFQQAEHGHWGVRLRAGGGVQWRFHQLRGFCCCWSEDIVKWVRIGGEETKQQRRQSQVNGKGSRDQRTESRL